MVKRVQFSGSDEAAPAKKRKVYEDDEEQDDASPATTGGDSNSNRNYDDSDAEEDTKQPVKNMDEVKGEEKFDMNFSLAADGVEIEPFNLKEEREGGGGYFDATGNYVFRRGGAGAGEEEDAWLDGLEDGKAGGKAKYGDDEEGEGDKDKEEEEGPREMTDAAKAAMYSAIATLLAPKETVPRGLRRLGALKPKRAAKGAAKAAVSPEAQAAASAFNQITEAADALLNAGEPDVYGMTREEASTKAQDCTTASAASNMFAVSAAGGEAGQMWEYRDPQGAMQGPFTSVQMFQWRSQGFFAGEQAVDVRKYVKQEVEVVAAPVVGGNVDDLMGDLDDSDDEEEEKVKPTAEVKPAAGGDEAAAATKWEKSDAINFALYC